MDARRSRWSARLRRSRFAAVLFVYGIQIARRNTDVETVALFFTFGVVYAIVPVAALAVAIHACVDVRTALRVLVAGAHR